MKPILIVLLIVFVLIVTNTPIMQLLAALFLFKLLAVSKNVISSGGD